MARRIEKDGKHFRMRRGKLVEIPPEWVGRVAFPGGEQRKRSREYRDFVSSGRRRPVHLRGEDAKKRPTTYRGDRKMRPIALTFVPPVEERVHIPARRKPTKRPFHIEYRWTPEWAARAPCLGDHDNRWRRMGSYTSREARDQALSAKASFVGITGTALYEFRAIDSE